MSDLNIDKKTDATINFQYYESDGTTARTLVDSTIFFTVKENIYDSDVDDSEATIKKTVTSHTNAGAGTSAITLTDTDTDVAPKKYFYDIKVKESDGSIYKAQSGRLTINPTITNRST